MMQSSERGILSVKSPPAERVSLVSRPQDIEGLFREPRHEPKRSERKGDSMIAFTPGDCSLTIETLKVVV